jgi:predicted metal-binding protein
MPYLEIKLGDIIFDPKVQTYCVSPNFKCPNYGHSWACPPEAPYFEERVSKFREFYLIYYQLNLNEHVKKERVKNPELSENQIKNRILIGNFLRNKLEIEIFTFLDNYQNNYDEKLVLWDGFCRVCSNEVDKGCNYDSGEPCRYPDKKRYSMEAVGIDVTKTVNKLNLNIEWPPTNYAYRFGLVCFK